MCLDRLRLVHDSEPWSATLAVQHCIRSAHRQGFARYTLTAVLDAKLSHVHVHKTVH